MGFPKKLKTDALVAARRSCCVCHRFAGLYAEVHHIMREADGGPDKIENAVVLCHECHGQAGHYDPRHPIGNRYSPEELRRHRDLWVAWCAANPGSPLPDDPVVVSPQRVILPAAREPLAETLSVPVTVTIRNRADVDLFSVWTRLQLPDAGLGVDALRVDGAVGPFDLEPRHVDQESGRILLKLASQGKGLPNYDLRESGVLVEDLKDGGATYLGINRLSAGEARPFDIEVARPASMTEVQAIPLEVISMSEEPVQWLLVEERAFILDVEPPDFGGSERGPYRVSLLDVPHLKRD